jgi:alpha,alpha-trehalose phosphorylase (configuration-retaining)
MLLNKLLNKIVLRPQSQYLESYGLVEVIEGRLRITHTKDGETKSYTVNIENENLEERLKEEIRKILLQHNHKLVATSFKEKELHSKIAPKLWLEEDVVSFLVKDNQSDESISVEESLKIVSSKFDKENIANIYVKKDNEVEVTDLVTLEDYQKTATNEEFNNLQTLAENFKGKTIVFINATPQGGGVALMRHALIRLYKLVGVDAHWYIVKPDLDVFNITKRKFHNVLQAVSAPGIELTKEDEELFNNWSKDNSEFLEDKYKKADVVVIDDPQPCGLIPYIKKVNPKAKIIYRSHIQIESKLTNKPGTPQRKTWQFIWNNIKLADYFVAHPVPSFIPKEVPKQKVVFMPAVTDPLDGLNKPLDRDHIKYYMHLFQKFLKVEDQTPLDLKRPYIIQIARFDPSKGIPDVLKAYLRLTQMLKGIKPQLIITGNGSIDDPDRAPIFNMVMEMIQSKEYKHLAKDIKVVRLPHIDQLLNTLLRESKVVLQLSIKEGFEIKVTEALMKGKPVIAYRTGGIPLQIRDGLNGYLVEPGDTEQVATHLYNLFTDEDLYPQMSLAAAGYFDRSLLTVPNATRWLELALRK